MSVKDLPLAPVDPPVSPINSDTEIEVHRPVCYYWKYMLAKKKDDDATSIQVMVCWKWLGGSTLGKEYVDGLTFQGTGELADCYLHVPFNLLRQFLRRGLSFFRWMTNGSVAVVDLEKGEKEDEDQRQAPTKPKRRRKRS